MDTSGLLKVLRLTASSHDGEALSAARQANRLLAARGLTWDDVVVVPRPNGAPRLSATAVIVAGRARLPPLPTWAATADFIAFRGARDASKIRLLGNLAIRLHRGEEPDAGEAEFLIDGYRAAGGIVR